MVDILEFKEYLDGSKGLDSWTIKIYLNYNSHFDINKFKEEGNKYLNNFIGKHNCPPCRAMIRHLINYVKTSDNPDPTLLDRCNKAIIERRTGAKPHKEKPKLSYTEVKKLADSMKDEWLKMMVLTAFNLGLRRSELVKLKKEDINLDTNEVLIQGKRNKERTIIMSERFSEQLVKFISDKVSVNKGYFTEEYPFIFPKYTAKKFEAILVKTAKEVGFNNIITSHCLRRSCATYLSTKDMPIEEIKEFLGHSSINTTAMYIVKPKEQALKRAADILNKVDQP